MRRWGTFRDDVIVITDALPSVTNESKLPEPVANALRATAPIYRKHWWADDDRANRFYIAYLTAIDKETEDEIVQRIERVYRQKFPAHLRVDIAAAGGEFGAYTTDEKNGQHVIISSRDDSMQGFYALEGLFHESSHTLVHPQGDVVSNAINTYANKAGMRPPNGLPKK